MIEVNIKLITHEPVKSVFLHCDNLENVHSLIFNRCGWHQENYYLCSNGHKVVNFEDIHRFVQVFPRLRGGKGGFGSMLRAIGAQIEKTTNREACRDLSGRRLRDINEEQRLKKWISQQAEREREIEERRKKKLEKLSLEPKHQFEDEKYFEERSGMSDMLNDAINQGIQVATSSGKRKIEVDKPVKKKKKLLMDMDEFSSSDDAEEMCVSDNEVASDSEISLNTQPVLENSSTKEMKNVKSLTENSAAAGSQVVAPLKNSATGESKKIDSSTENIVTEESRKADSPLENSVIKESKDVDSPIEESKKVDSPVEESKEVDSPIEETKEVDCSSEGSNLKKS